MYAYVAFFILHSEFFILHSSRPSSARTRDCDFDVIRNREDGEESPSSSALVVLGRGFLDRPPPLRGFGGSE